jgi:hypothetical protein
LPPFVLDGTTLLQPVLQAQPRRRQNIGEARGLQFEARGHTARQRPANVKLCREVGRTETYTAMGATLARLASGLEAKNKRRTSGTSARAGIIGSSWRMNLPIYREKGMKGNLVIVCRDQDATAFDELMAEYGAFQTRLSSTAWYLKLDSQPEDIQEEILARLGKYTTHYIFEANSVTYNTVDSEAAAALDALFAE